MSVRQFVYNRRGAFESQFLEEGHLRLETDYRDFYDHWFAAKSSDHPVFKRYSSTRRTRLQDLLILERHGLMVPRYGPVHKLAPWLRKHREKPVVVVHFGDGGRQHRGEGKMVVSVKATEDHLSMAEYSWGSCPGVEYIDQPEDRNPVSFRYLQIGEGKDRIRCWFRYQSKSDTWRSNVGDVEVDFIADPRPVGQRTPINILTIGLYAVDFVVSRKGVFYAVDYNTSPGLRHSGLETMIEGEEVYDIIRTTYHKNIREWRRSHK